MTITQARFAAVREALPQVGDRFADLVTAAGDPSARAVGSWSIADTAAHVGFIALMYTSMIYGLWAGKPVVLGRWDGLGQVGGPVVVSV